jgi:hypothetical protein
MAVDIHALNLFRFAAGVGDFGRVATIGRQNLKVPSDQVNKLLNTKSKKDLGPFCEDLLLTHFGATLVDTYDFSPFEGASHIADFNHPLATESRYDTIIDCGTLEHIYNVPQALKNISGMCADGGRILHVLPANNYCGHGFWQFSPELFYSLYCETNGYQGTRVFLAKVADDLHWYEVSPPKNGQRVDITSCTRMLILVITKRQSFFSHSSVQQSDYVHAWGSEAPKNTTSDPLAITRIRIRDIISKTPLFPLARVIYDQLAGKTTLSKRNPFLLKRVVTNFVGRS